MCTDLIRHVWTFKSDSDYQPLVLVVSQKNQFSTFEELLDSFSTRVFNMTPSDRLLSRYSCSAKVRANTYQIKHTKGKNKLRLVGAPIFRVTEESTVKCHHFESCNFYKVLYGERARPCLFRSSAIQNLIKIAIFKLMALWWSDSEKFSKLH